MNLADPNRLGPIKVVARLPPKTWRMAFHPRRAFNLEVAGIATLILSVALIAYVLIAIWTTS
jgi:hypothetical protein